MKPWLIEILVCPDADCRGDLSITVFESHKEDVDGETFEEIDEALLTCQRCGRWYPVIDGIACLLPDSLRLSGKQRIEEERFLVRWQDRIDEKILNSGRPFGLGSKRDQPSEA